MLDRRSDLDWLHEIHCPTLVIADERDALRSLTEADELHRGIAGSDLMIIEGAGYMVPIEAPGRLVAAIASWLRKLG